MDTKRSKFYAASFLSHYISLDERPSQLKKSMRLLEKEFESPQR